jgi:hypothetical protein
MQKTAQFLVAAIGDINDPATLHQLARKVRKQLRAVGVDPDKKTQRATNGNGTPTTQPKASSSNRPATPAVNLTDFKPGEKIVFGTAHGEKTTAEVVKVNRKRLQVKLLEQRGRKKALPAGATFDVDPTQFQVSRA